MSDRPSLIQQVSTITGCNDFQASLVLERCNWDMERAVNSFFDDPPPEVSRATLAIISHQDRLLTLISTLTSDNSYRSR